MIDGHVHLERGAYTKEWMQRFVHRAKMMGITQLYLLEHTHRFEEFRGIYDSIFEEPLVAKEQKEWFYKKPKIKLNEYTEFINEMKKIEWQIEVKFGLEVCYFPEKEVEIKSALATYPWDFVTGSVHWIDGWGFDNPNTVFSWKQKNTNLIYKKYYEIMIQLVESKLFNILAHPDSIKCFNYYPTRSLEADYEKLAKTLKENNVKTEFSSGLHINYNHKELGINRELLKVLLDHHVEIITVSDAHRPEDVGKYIKEGEEIISLLEDITKKSVYKNNHK